MNDDERTKAAIRNLELAGERYDDGRVQDANFTLEAAKVHALLAIAQRLDEVNANLDEINARLNTIIANTEYRR